MCGIAGIYGAENLISSHESALNLIAKMTRSFKHRGPDADGHWSDPKGRCHLGHRRLSIIDTSQAGAQPMQDHKKKWVISFNGEIYNFREVRAELEAAGVRSVTTAVQDGLAGNEIVDYAQRLGCEAIVMATRGHSGLGREVVGSVAEYILRHSGNAAVVLVGPRVA